MAGRSGSGERYRAITGEAVLLWDSTNQQPKISTPSFFELRALNAAAELRWLADVEDGPDTVNFTGTAVLLWDSINEQSPPESWNRSDDNGAFEWEVEKRLDNQYLLWGDSVRSEGSLFEHRIGCLAIPGGVPLPTDSRLRARVAILAYEYLGPIRPLQKRRRLGRTANRSALVRRRGRPRH